MGNTKKYKYTVIMPIYNVEKYLNEAIESVINQSIGFEDNIQLILVNDGSKDRSGEICKTYKKRYPNNIVYIEQENRGVSNARNVGMKFIKGKYVNFFDSDDKWDIDTFEKVWHFFETNNEAIDVVCCKPLFFEAKKGQHSLNNKFKKGDRIIDIEETPYFMLLNVTTAFIKANMINIEKFDERISIGEDSKYISKIILQKKKYGVLDSAKYYIRKRNEKTSITQNRNIGRYTQTIEHYYKHMLEYSINEYGEILPYIQYIVMNGIKYRVFEAKKDFMTDKEWLQYTRKIISIIKRIDDEVIANTHNTRLSTRLYLFKLKYDKDITDEVYIDKGSVCFRGIKIGKVSNKNVEIHNATKHWWKITLEGIIKVPINDNIGLYVRRKNNYCPVMLNNNQAITRTSFTGEAVIVGFLFKITTTRMSCCNVLFVGNEYNYVKILCSSIIKVF